MSDSVERKTTSLHEKRLQEARKSYERFQKVRDSLEERNKGRDKKLDQLLEEREIRLTNRMKRIEKDRENRLMKRRISYLIFFAVGLLVTIIVMEHLVPGSRWKREGYIDDTPIDEVIDVSAVDSNDPTNGESGDGEAAGFSGEGYGYNPEDEEKILWNLLMEHFEGNTNAVLGVMCNLKEESKFVAENLEDYNNDIWEIDDHEYTEKVNRKTISEQDFLEARINDYSNGYYNEYEQWVNTDGGYGYAQFTSYEKKEELYRYAEMWFGPGGQGEGKKFNIGDPEMQANYVVYLLNSENFAALDNRLREAPGVVDACYIWLELYEVPYDPYGDGYYTMAFERADAAAGIEERCAE